MAQNKDSPEQGDKGGRHGRGDKELRDLAHDVKVQRRVLRFVNDARVPGNCWWRLTIESRSTGQLQGAWTIAVSPRGACGRR